MKSPPPVRAGGLRIDSQPLILQPALSPSPTRSLSPTVNQTVWLINHLSSPFRLGPSQQRRNPAVRYKFRDPGPPPPVEGASFARYRIRFFFPALTSVGAKTSVRLSRACVCFHQPLMGCLTSPFSLLMSFMALCFFFSFSLSLNFFFSLSSLSRSFALSLLECSVESEREGFRRHEGPLAPLSPSQWIC